MTIPASEFQQRRRQLMRMMDDSAIAVIPSAIEQFRNKDVDYPFRQDSDFQYLTQFPEPDAVLVLVPGRDAAETILFCRERDPQKETWNGLRAGTEGAVRDYGIDDAFPIDHIEDILPGLIEKANHIFYTMGVQPAFDARMIGWLNALRDNPTHIDNAQNEFVSLEPFLHDMRLYKSRAEIKLMQRAADISAAAHQRAMQQTAPGRFEYEIEAELLHEFHRHGTTVAYNSIVGGGANGCILHYTNNDAVLNDNELLLIDAACEVECYASDITRTFPINGRFTPAQRAIYDVVLRAQLAGIDAMRPGNDWNRSHEVAVQHLTEGLVELGILKGDPAELIEQHAYRPFYMHRTGHWLGLDVHDVGAYRVGEQWRELEPGMVMTVEPGLYIPAGSKGVDRKWWNIGIRIEDDVLVTRDEPRVLSDKIVKHPDDIERLMNAA